MRSQDLEDLDILIEPFFVARNEWEIFNLDHFYGVSWTRYIELNRNWLGCYACQPLLIRESDDRDAPSMSVQQDLQTTFDTMRRQMLTKESTKRKAYTIPFEIATGLTIGVKGFVTPSINVSSRRSRNWMGWWQIHYGKQGLKRCSSLSGFEYSSWRSG